MDSIGVARVETFGSYLMLINYRQPYFLQVYTAYSDGYQYSGRFFRKGKGPKDFLGFQVIKKEYPCLWIQDYMNKHVKKINIEQGFDDRSFIIEKIYSYKKTVDPFNVFYLSDTCFLIKDYDVNKGLYYLKYNPEKESISSEEFILYNYPVTYPLMNKMLTLADVLHPRGNKIASITGVFNQIDILNLDNPDKNISVTTNQKPVKYQDVMNTGKEDFQEYYFSYPVCNEQMIFVLYHSQDANKPVQIHVIDWDGNPVAKLHLDKNIRDIHIDFNEKIIYGIEDESERVYKFNIKTGNFRLLG
ncbi:MAG: TolB-like 6-bladed beta-propeller domain-containing protein [Dysgonamonadaceae bacterium]|nr:TolB-like 6-bladed beta-propeller domain-containing protein [Dysgonamonadaceae bacterium]